MYKCAGHVCEWERTCLPAGHPGAGVPDSLGGAAVATIATQPSTALLTVHIWGGSHFEEFKISSLRRSLWRASTSAPRCVSTPSTLGRAVHTATRIWDQRLWYLLGRELLLPLPWAPWEPQTRQTPADESADWLRCCVGHRRREMAQVIAGCRDHTRSRVGVQQHSDRSLRLTLMEGVV